MMVSNWVNLSSISEKFNIHFRKMDLGGLVDSGQVARTVKKLC